MSAPSLRLMVHMSEQLQQISRNRPAGLGGAEIFVDGRDKIISTPLSAEDFLANEDEGMNALIKLYRDRCVDGQIPEAGAITPEKLFVTGMMSRTHCLRVAQSAGSFRYAVWAQDANFDGYRSLQNMALDDRSPFPILTKVVQAQLSAALVHGRMAFFDVRGVINDRYYYFTKAILPLRNEQGEIVKCFVPFTDKLPDIPPHLREDFCTRGVE